MSLFHRQQKTAPVGLEVVGEEDWRRFSACKDCNVWEQKDFCYKDEDDECIERAKVWCGRCAVKEECLQVALRDVRGNVVMGGTTEAERVEIRRAA